MPRPLTIAGAQLGPIQPDENRTAVVRRMLDLMDQAQAADASLIVYPELALTTFFPRYYYPDRAGAGRWFEDAMPGIKTQPLFDRARAYNMGFSIGYAERTDDGRHFNSQIIVDQTGQIIGKYRKVHLPGHDAFDPKRAFQHLEKRYFLPGDLGFPVWRGFGGYVGTMICNDRRWAESWRVLGLQGVELVVLGYNTPSVNSQNDAEGPERRLFHNALSIQAGAYQNSCFAVAVAKAGIEDGHPMIGGSMIVNPDGEILAQATSEADELITASIDLDDTAFGKKTIFDFARHRRIEHYGPITAQTGVIHPQ